MKSKAENLVPSKMQDRPTIRFYRDIDDIDRLETVWADLAATTDQPLYFQSPIWLRHVAAIKSRGASDDWQIYLATAWRGDRLTAIWPLSLQREGLCTIARCLDDPIGQFAGFLADDDEDPQQAIDSIIHALRSKGLAAGLMIERVVEGSALHRSLAANGAKITYSDQSAVIDFRPHDSFQSYLKTRKSKTRKNLRNARNRLERDHGVEHEIVTGSGDIRSIMDQAFEARLVWMQDQAKTAPAFRDPDFRCLLDGLPESAAGKDLIGFRLRAGDTPIAVQWGFLHAGRYYAFISARNPAFDAYSPGRLHLSMVLEACFERGVDMVELMAPASDYKMNWTDQARQIDDFGLALTASGYLYLDLWRRHGRSMARRLYHGLPDGVRRHVAGMANKNLAS
ncbi:MAG: GNAT family N-acetyltransferase [Alphaproteobacteria bacterium]|nr:GNAT family N-acetyltransferase [Alphaproteobacteria bacterium]